MKTFVGNITHRLRSLAAHEGARRYFFNTGWMFAEKGLRLIAGLFIGAYVARYLGPAQYGLLNYAISLVALFTVVAMLGMETIIVREIVANPSRRNVVLGTAFAIKAIAALIMIASLIAVVTFSEGDPKARKLIFIIGIGIIFESFVVIDNYFQSRTLSKYVVWSQIAALIGVSIFRVILVVNEAPLIWFGWSSVVDLFIVSVGFVLFYSANSEGIRSWRVDWKLAKQFLNLSWPLIFSSVAVTIYMRIDQVMVKAMLGEEANGYYGVAVRLSELWNFIPMAICSSLFPAILNAKTISSELYLRRMQWLYNLMVVISVSIAIPMTFLSDWIVVLLFGEDYRSAGSVISWYIWSGVFVFLGVASGKWIISENLQVVRMVILVISCIINIVLNYLLIKSIGLNGSAISTLISYAFAGYFGYLFTRKTRPAFVAMTRSFNPYHVVKSMLGQRVSDI